MDRPVRLVQLQLGRVPLAGADEWCVRFGAGMLVVPLQGAAAGCRCRVPLQGAAAGCRCRSGVCAGVCAQGQGRPSLTPVGFWLGKIFPLLCSLSYYSPGAGGSRREATRILSGHLYLLLST